MTDTTNSATTAAPTTTAADAGASSATPTNAQNATGQAAGTTEPSSSTPTPDQTAAPKEGADKTNSGNNDPAQDHTKPDADKAKPAEQPSDDQKTDDSKKDDEGKDKKEEGKEAQPIEYQPFTMPEGMELDNDALKEALPVLQGLKADQAQAQKLVDVAATMISKVMKQASEQHNQTVEGWRKESESIFGKEGESKFKERIGRAEEVVKQFFNEDQRGILSSYGLGNHPAFFAMCLAIAEGTTEDRGILPASTGGFHSKQTLANTWYPDSNS